MRLTGNGSRGPQVALEYRVGGRKVSSGSFMKSIERQLVDQAMDGYVEELHGKASSVVDPLTGKHALDL